MIKSWWNSVFFYFHLTPKPPILVKYSRPVLLWRHLFVWLVISALLIGWKAHRCKSTCSGPFCGHLFLSHLPEERRGLSHTDAIGNSFSGVRFWAYGRVPQIKIWDTGVRWLWPTSERTHLEGSPAIKIIYPARPQDYRLVLTNCGALRFCWSKSLHTCCLECVSFLLAPFSWFCPSRYTGTRGGMNLHKEDLSDPRP